MNRLSKNKIGPILNHSNRTNRSRVSSARFVPGAKVQNFARSVEIVQIHRIWYHFPCLEPTKPPMALEIFDYALVRKLKIWRSGPGQ